MSGLLLFGLTALLVGGCASEPRYTTGNRPAGKRTVTRSNPRALSSTSRVRKGMVLSGISSFYGPDFHGKTTANGEVYDMYGLSAAHKTLPFNTIVRVTNLNNNRKLIVRINDRGPYVRGRMLDLSYGAALKLGFVNEGTTKVRVEVLEVGDGLYMKRLPSNP
ncbi:MAG: septal ring lytic transglycosylase RlpA family protein [Candidatus Marinimicrobia bacterium]|nr:septal ring lytic transglycosylase RlpA family protein [Candidatus Neomarinimicrobiota bacterium]